MTAHAIVITNEMRDRLDSAAWILHRMDDMFTGCSQPIVYALRGILDVVDLYDMADEPIASRKAEEEVEIPL